MKCGFPFAAPAADPASTIPATMPKTATNFLTDCMSCPLVRRQASARTSSSLAEVTVASGHVAVISIDTFRSVGADEDFLAADKRVQTEFFYHQPGLVR